MPNLTPARRRWAYRVAAALLVTLGVYGVVDGEQSHALLLLFAALFGVAHANVED